MKVKQAVCTALIGLLFFIVLVSPLSAAGEFILYKITPGDTLSSVAQRFGSTVEALAAYNLLADPDKIFAGQNLKIPAAGANSYIVQSGDTLWAIAARHGVSVSSLAAANAGLDPQRLTVGSAIHLPPGERLVVSSRSSSSSLVPLRWPLTGQITSPYGWRDGRMHQGIDIGGNLGQAIRAAAAGQVSYTGWCGGFGNRLVIDHGRGVQTLYAHCSAILVKPGDWVWPGQTVARVGSTGNSTGPHLHFEVHRGGRPIDPRSALPPR